MRHWILATVMFATIPAAAIPGAGAIASIPRPQQENPQAPRSHDPAIVLEQGLENMLGQELNPRELRTLTQAVRELEQIQAQRERPQQVNFVYDFFSTNDFLPIICIHGRGSIKIPNIGPVTLGGFGGTMERSGCILTNSINPMAWDWRKFKSYRMSGVSTTNAGSVWGGLTVGASIGIYIGPKNNAHPFIGTYGFFRLVYDKGIGSANLMGAYSQGPRGRQAMIMGGGSVEILSWRRVLEFAKVVPKIEPGVLALGPWKVEFGAQYDIAEHPWFHRLMNGESPYAAFKDFDTFVAAN